MESALYNCYTTTSKKKLHKNFMPLLTHENACIIYTEVNMASSVYTSVTFKPAAGGYLQIGGVLRCRRAGENLSVIVVVVKFFSGLDSWASGDIRKIIGRQWVDKGGQFVIGCRRDIGRSSSDIVRSPSRAIIGRYHTIVRGLAGISPGSLRVPRGIRQEPGRYPAETYARCMTKLVKK